MVAATSIVTGSCKKVEWRYTFAAALHRMLSRSTTLHSHVAVPSVVATSNLKSVENALSSTMLSSASVPSGIL